jgi:hypothetical protein
MENIGAALKRRGRAPVEMNCSGGRQKNFLRTRFCLEDYVQRGICGAVPDGDIVVDSQFGLCELVGIPYKREGIPMLFLCL